MSAALLAIAECRSTTTMKTLRCPLIALLAWRHVSLKPLLSGGRFRGQPPRHVHTFMKTSPLTYSIEREMPLLLVLPLRSWQEGHLKLL